MPLIKIPPSRRLERQPRDTYTFLASYAVAHCMLCQSPPAMVYPDEHCPGNPLALCVEHDRVVMKLVQGGAEILALKWDILGPMGVGSTQDEHVLFLIAGGVILQQGLPLVERRV